MCNFWLKFVLITYFNMQIPPVQICKKDQVCLTKTPPMATQKYQRKIKTMIISKSTKTVNCRFPVTQYKQCLKVSLNSWYSSNNKVCLCLFS